MCGSRWAASRPSCPSTTWTDAQWNFDALGENKRKLAGVLLRRLKDSFSPGGLLHFGQGKWYPGRAAAALGPDLPVAHRRHAAVARCEAARRGGQGLRAPVAGRAGVLARAGGTPGPAPRLSDPGLRGRVGRAQGRARGPGQRRSAASATSRTPASARASRTCWTERSRIRSASSCRSSPRRSRWPAAGAG